MLQAGQGGVRAAQMPVVDRLHEVRTREWKKRPLSLRTLRDVARLRREMRAEAYDVCVDLQGSIRVGGDWADGRSEAVCGRGGASGAAVGMAVWGERVAVTGASVIEQACELVGAAVGGRVEAAKVALPRDEEAEVWAEARLRGGQRVVLLVPTCGWGAKAWGLGEVP